MFSRIISHTVKRLGAVRPANGVQPTRTSFAAFSSAEIVPGIGRGKTSTGIVRVSKRIQYWLVEELMPKDHEKKHLTYLLHMLDSSLLLFVFRL
jgi:hypothetical protein